MATPLAAEAGSPPSWVSEHIPEPGLLSALAATGPPEPISAEELSLALAGVSPSAGGSRLRRAGFRGAALLGLESVDGSLRGSWVVARMASTRQARSYVSWVTEERRRTVDDLSAAQKLRALVDRRMRTPRGHASAVALDGVDPRWAARASYVFSSRQFVVSLVVAGSVADSAPLVGRDRELARVVERWMEIGAAARRMAAPGHRR